MTTPLVTREHTQAVTASIPEVAGLLSQLLSRRMTAYLAGVGEVKTVSRWVNGEVTQLRDIQREQRLRQAYEIAQLLLQRNASDVVRAWFISLNPQLGDRTPVEALHDGQLQDALAAARAFAAEG